MKKISEKYNEACIKIFDMLKLLSDGTAKYKDIIDLFSPDEANPVSGAHVILNKYLNTLKIFGINIRKSKNMYYLQNSFFSLNLNENEIKMFQLMKSTGESLSNAKQKELFDAFIKDVEIRLTSSSRELLLNSNDDKNTALSEYFAKYRDIIEKCESYCQENHKIEVSFVQDNKDYKVIRQVFDVPVDSITLIKQMPTLSPGCEVGMTVVYKIRNNLAKAYRLKEWETTDGKYDEQGWLTIVNTKENFDVLIKRLMRYDYNCIVVSPKNFRELMVSAIDDTLKNYE